jgi:hypothetical protein
MSTRKPHPSISDKIIRFIFGIIVFSALVSGGTYYLQSSLFILQVMGLYAHWAVILILLPAFSGLVQHLIVPPARLLVAMMGSLASSTILYPLYAERFWAIPPSATDTIVFTLVIAHLQVEPHKDGLVEGLLNSSIVRSFELSLTVLSFILAFWGTFSLGMSAMK